MDSISKSKLTLLLRLHNGIRQFIANDIGEDPCGLAVLIALSAAHRLVIFDL